MTQYNTILEQEGEAAEITINRPKSLNALSLEVIEEMLTATLQEMSEEARILVIKGSGERAFVAGADIKPMLDLNVRRPWNFQELVKCC